LQVWFAVLPGIREIATNLGNEAMVGFLSVKDTIFLLNSSNGELLDRKTILFLTISEKPISNFKSSLFNF
jgi:hypothetical protein